MVDWAQSTNILTKQLITFFKFCQETCPRPALAWNFFGIFFFVFQEGLWGISLMRISNVSGLDICGSLACGEEAVGGRSGTSTLNLLSLAASFEGGKRVECRVLHEHRDKNTSTKFARRRSVSSALREKPFSQTVQ